MKYKNFLKNHGNQNIHFKDGYYVSLNELYQAFEEERKEEQKEPECDHRVGYIPMFKDGDVIFVYESQGIKIHKPFKNCPDCGKEL